MKLSKETLNLLKNFAAINPSIYIKKGQVLSTMSVDKNSCAFSNVDETFPNDCAIYDLPEFLSVIDLFSDPEFEFSENSVKIYNANSECVYGYSEPDVIVYPSKKINFPPVVVEFDISKDQLERLLRASNTLGLDYINITKLTDSQDIVMSVVDPKNPSSHTFSLVVGSENSEAEYNYLINTAYLKLQKSDYIIKLAEQPISLFESDDGVEYFVALDKNSKYSSNA